MAAATETELERRIARLNQKLGDWIPPRDSWTPAEKAALSPLDLLNVPLNEAQQMQFKAVKYTFTRHYTLNKFYHRYCDECRFTPDDVKTHDDVAKIPLIPDLTFKYHPEGEDFAHWIAQVYTGELPIVILKSANPTFDDVITAFNKAGGLVVAYSSGTSGLPSVIPRDERTFYTFQYVSAKIGNSLRDGTMNDHSLSLFPKPTDANLGITRSTEVAERLCEDHSYALDLKITADVAAKAMTGNEEHKGARRFNEEQMREVLKNGITWFYRNERTTGRMIVVTPPVLLLACMDILEQQGKRFEFGERAVIQTVGGWKTHTNEQIPSEPFRKRVEEMFGIPETNIADIYGMIEMNGCAISCPEGHYYHLPYTYLKPLVLDSDLEPVGYGELGRFAFLDSLAATYPGFIMSGDQVRLLEHCPVCDRPGPVLDPVIDRLSSEELRGCAAQVLGALEYELQGA